MFTLRKTKQIEASHQLPHHDGKCKGLHGHTWTISVEVKGEALNTQGPKRGMLFDYYDLGQLMKAHVERLDHRHLNDLYPNPTSEVIAQAIYEAMALEIEIISKGQATLSRVLVSETASSCAEYSK